MKILFIEPYYEPDGGPAAPLFTMLCKELSKRGHEVTVLTAVPHYPSGCVPFAYRGCKTRRSKENGVQVIRVPLPSLDRANLVQRFIQFLIFQIGATISGWKVGCDVFVTITPSLEVLLPFHYFSVIRCKPAVYSIHDIYPDSGVQLGIFRKKEVIKWVTYLEKSCLKRAAIVRILSQSFKEKIIELGVPPSKIRLIYDWVDTDLIYPLHRNNKFAQENRLVNSFIVLYAGNIGFSQDLKNVLKCAQKLVNENIQFVFVGEGPAKQSLIEYSISLQLPNVRFLPFQPRVRLPEVLASTDLSLVTLRQGMGFNSLPSKTLSILASGRPLIACVDPGSDTWHLVERSQSGLCIPPEDPESLARAILTLKRNSKLKNQMGVRGREYVLNHHSPKMAAKAFEKILVEALENSK
jgi:colanic acid biosynthesis glycosyl transferase WcaI